MKKFILSSIAVLMFSFLAFSNSVMGEGNSVEQDEQVLMKNANIAVNFLQKELKLKNKDSKLKELKKAYMAYAKKIIMLNEKIESKNKTANGDKNIMMRIKKERFNKMMDATKERDKKISEFLSKKQLEKYRSSSKAIHPFSLMIKEDKIKVK